MKNKKKRRLLPSLCCAFLLFVAPLGLSACGAGNDEDVASINTLRSNLQSAGICNISFLGDSITTYIGWSNNATYNSTIGGNAVYYTDTKTESIKSVDDTWWKQVLDLTDTNLCVNNSYSGDKVVKRGILRALQLHDDIGNPDNGIINPDMIIVYLGVNDFNAKTEVEYFKAAYDYMVSGMTGKYSDSKIYLGTILPSDRYVNAKLLDQYNAAIKEIAAKYKIGVVDFYKDSGITVANMSSYLWEGLHPNALGMDAMTNTVINRLIKDFR